MTTSERFFGEVLFTKYAHKVLFPRKKKKKEKKEVETNDSRIFSCSQLLSLPLLSVLLFLMMTHVTAGLLFLTCTVTACDCRPSI